MVAVLVIIGVLVLSFAVSLGCTAIVVWAGLELLKMLGIATIAFSWKLVIIVAIIITALKSIFKTVVNVER